MRRVGKSNQENFEDLRQRLFPDLKHTFNASRSILTFANGSRILARHYLHEQEIDAFLGFEYDVIGIEEVTTLTERKFKDLRTCLRTSKPDWHPRLYSTTNPGGVGHDWNHRLFILPHEHGVESSFDAMNPLGQRASQLKPTEGINLPNPSSPSLVAADVSPLHLQSTRTQSQLPSAAVVQFPVISRQLGSLSPPAATHPALKRFRVVSGRQPLFGWRTRRIPRPVTRARGRKQTKADSVTLFGGFSCGRK